MNSKNKKKKTGGAAWAAIAAVILIVNMLDGLDEGDLHFFFLRLRHNPTLAIAILAVVISVVIAVIALAAAKRRSADAVNAHKATRSETYGGGTAAQHSHDRIQGYTGGENEYEHWKKQLDGFLAAGIIDRKEYQALLERRKTSY